MKPEILIVDDEQDIRSMLAELLEDEGYTCRTAANAEEARQSVQEFLPSLVILDIWMNNSDMDGLVLQQWIRRLYPDVPAIMISGHGNIETAVQAMKDGAYDFIEKPFKSDRLLILVERALKAAMLEAENNELRKTASVQSELIGEAPSIKALRQSIEKVAHSNSRVMITGPSGSGKELAARRIHQLSERNSGRFVVANCAMLSPESVTAELFGTEANPSGHRIVGLFEQAHGGTLYFDEIGDLPLETQGKLVRAVQDQRFRRVGGTAEVTVDVRVISGSKLNLNEEVENGNLREDLFYRLSVVPIILPPLNARKEDIPELSRFYLDQANTGSGKKLALSDEAIAMLQMYEWPGNVTQLLNVIDWLTIMANPESEGLIMADDLPPEISGTAAEGTGQGFETVVGLPLKAAREHFETQYLISQLTRFDGNVSKTAEFVGMERSALHRKLKSLNINPDKSD
ncbi:MAG: sigma-54-dependent Fis family transcriptional regulator [SAR116 cluster bacterium MED-G04]|jgi:two-component system nitrogen regulation response regulator NtrX|nr:MAG: sigma-54-dependent Fis family transcriptional regulator [SAR116 cluster bacterium MED-G04]CAI8320289.1 MAG: Nitrogen regulation protein NR(I) [SAR116 cluster bacterium MED-G04]HCD49680.1 sigma-54-dependent Fis family transcriptional regulator [Alphaproteobacteria bacterium]|tara:strand:- start:4327 stop:5703 length:1377 start_codon:yes stop_codon:yes gene_type:complete